MALSVFGAGVIDTFVFDTSGGVVSGLKKFTIPGRPSAATRPAPPAPNPQFDYFNVSIGVADSQYRKSHCTSNPRYSCS